MQNEASSSVSWCCSSQVKDTRPPRSPAASVKCRNCWLFMFGQVSKPTYSSWKQTLMSPVKPLWTESYIDWSVCIREKERERAIMRLGHNAHMVPEHLQRTLWLGLTHESMRAAVTKSATAILPRRPRLLVRSLRLLLQSPGS